MAEDRVILEARFNPKYVSYHVLQVSVVFVLTIVGIPLLLVAVPLTWFLRSLELKHISLVLTSKSVKVRKGVFNKIEKTIPLEKITDLAIYHGPIMRFFGLEGLTVETAGQSSMGPLVALVGVENAEGFRDRALEQKEALAEHSHGVASSPSAPAERPDDKVLTDIRDTLLRIEQKLDKP